MNTVLKSSQCYNRSHIRTFLEAYDRANNVETYSTFLRESEENFRILNEEGSTIAQLEEFGKGQGNKSLAQVIDGLTFSKIVGEFLNGWPKEIYSFMQNIKAANEIIEIHNKPRSHSYEFYRFKPVFRRLSKYDYFQRPVYGKRANGSFHNSLHNKMVEKFNQVFAHLNSLKSYFQSMYHKAISSIPKKENVSTLEVEDCVKAYGYREDFQDSELLTWSRNLILNPPKIEGFSKVVKQWALWVIVEFKQYKDFRPKFNLPKDVEEDRAIGNFYTRFYSQ